MKVPPSLERAAALFDRMSLRERSLIAAATAIAVLMLWTVAVMDPLSAKSRSLSSELSSLQATGDANSQVAEQAAASDATARLLEQEKQLGSRLALVNQQLATKSGGLIAPERMVQVIHDVLSNQRGITLLSLQNKPVIPLIEPPAGEAARLDGPYVHRVELVIEGRYLDIMNYLHALEALPWRFYWRSLELKTTQYPVNRVSIELSTLSLDKDWIGV